MLNSNLEKRCHSVVGRDISSIQKQDSHDILWEALLFCGTKFTFRYRRVGKP